MIKKRFSIFLILCMITVAYIVTAFAEYDDEDGIAFSIDNTRIITADRNATFIEGKVAKASGQTILVKLGFRVIAEKIMPSTGNQEAFRMRIPAKYISKNRLNVYSVVEKSAENEKTTGKDRVEISYVARETQTIKTDRKEYRLTFPGLDKEIVARATSGDSLIYTSSNPEVVKVDSNGKLVATGGGDATITIKQIGNSRYEGTEEDVKVSVEELDAYTITFHSSADEKDEVIKQIVETGETVNLDGNPFDNGDHSFLGWATSDDGLVEYTDAEQVSELAETGGNVDLYAVWTGDGARAAVAWAISVANDDSFAYGTGDACHSAGCYFCGTNQRNKPRGYEKTYVCLTFAEAAYAHGAEDPELLAECQVGKRCMAVNDSNFSRYSCWERVGYTKNLTLDDLLPGDVICFYSPGGYDNGHMEIYAGNNSIVDAAYEGWGSDTISLRQNQAEGDLRYATSHSSNSYVMRYVGPNANK